MRRAWFAILSLACSSETQPAPAVGVADAEIIDAPDAAVADAEIIDSPPPPDAATCRQPTGPASAQCQGIWCDGPVSTSWVVSQIASGVCGDPPNRLHELYTYCEPRSFSATLADCTNISVGQSWCFNTLSTICQSDADCPPPTGCYFRDDGGFGRCELRCTAPGNAECGNCLYACDVAAGFCVGSGGGCPISATCHATLPSMVFTIHVPNHGYAPGYLAVQVPGSPTIYKEIRCGGDISGMTLVYPSGATAGPATARFDGTFGVPLHAIGETTFEADPTGCTRVTIETAIVGSGTDAGTP